MLFLILNYTSFTSDQLRCVSFSYCYVHCAVQCGVVCDLICVISGLLFMPARHTTCHFICLWLHNIPLTTLRCTKRSRSFVVKFMIWVYELMCLMSGLYFMPARDYTCCFLYLLLRLTTSLLTCYDITGCDRSMYYLSCWVVAGFAASRLFTYTNNLVRYVCTYKLSSNDLCDVVLFSPHVFLFPKCLVYMVSLSYKRDQSLQHERKCNGMSIDSIVNVVICTS